MDFERIQQIASTIKVKRAGSQQQRHRRDEDPEEFAEALEENLKEDGQDSKDSKQQQDKHPQDKPLHRQDTVSFSSEGMVSSETYAASGSLARISLAQRQLEQFRQYNVDVVVGEDVVEEIASEPGERKKPGSKLDEVV